MLLRGLAALTEFGPGIGWNVSRTILRGFEGGDVGRMAPANACLSSWWGIGLVAIGVNGQPGSLVCMLCGTTVAAQNGVALLGASSA